MASPTTTSDFLAVLRKSELVTEAELNTFLTKHSLPDSPQHAAGILIRNGLITQFQARLLLAGKYRGFTIGGLKVLDQLGKGGMGAVYLCEQTGLRRKVAVKVLPQKQAKDPVTRERFYREGRAAAALDHPNIVRVYDITSIGDLHYLTMEYVDGIDLQQLINHEGAIPYDKAVGYILQAAEGLAHAHERGLVHRDIKPANLLVDKQGHVKILDMGLARFFDDPRDDLTQRYEQGAVLGTVDFLAPEQALQSSKADIRSDIYSLGVTLYTIILGKPPFGGNTTEKLLHHQVKTPDPLHKVRADVPPELSQVVSRMMAKDPLDRYQSPAEVIAALTPWASEAPTQTKLETRPIPKTAPQPEKVASPAPAKRRILPVGVAASVLLIGTCVALWLNFAKTSSEPPAKQVAEVPNPPSQLSGPEPKTPPQPSTDDPPATQIANPPAMEAPIPIAIKNGPTTNVLVDARFDDYVGGSIRIRGNQTLQSQGKIPPEWKLSCWDKETVLEARIETIDNRPALSIWNQEGKPSAMLFTPYFRQDPNRGYLLELEYRTLGTSGASISFWEENARARKVAEVGSTQGKWAKTRIAHFASQPTKARFEVHPRGVGPEEALQIRNIQIRQEGTAVKPLGTSVQRIDFSRETPFVLNLKYQGNDGKTGEGNLPTSWSASCWRAGETASIGVETVEEANALFLRNTLGTSLQILSTQFLGKLEAGIPFLIRMTYKAERKAHGELQIRPTASGRYAPGLTFRHTHGTWRTLEVLITPEAGEKFRLFLQNLANGPETTIWVRELEVRRLPLKSAEEMVRYHLDLPSSQPLAQWLRKDEILRQTGDGRFPVGWTANTPAMDVVGQAAIEDHAGMRVLALRYNEGKGGVRFGTPMPIMQLAAGKRYKIMFSYQAAVDARGVLTLHDRDQGELLRMALPTAPGDWRTMGAIVQPMQDTNLMVAIQNYATSSEGSFFLRGFDIVEVDIPR